jgi:hypothetical protein
MIISLEYAITIFAVFIAVITILPGIWALVNQVNKDKKETQFRIEESRYLEENMIGIVKDIQDRLFAIEKYDTPNEIQKRLYEKPVIIRCKYCNTANLVDNINCVSCGAPIE